MLFIDFGVFLFKAISEQASESLSTNGETICVQAKCPFYLHIARMLLQDCRTQLYLCQVRCGNIQEWFSIRVDFMVIPVVIVINQWYHGYINVHHGYISGYGNSGCGNICL